MRKLEMIQTKGESMNVSYRSGWKMSRKKTEETTVDKKTKGEGNWRMGKGDVRILKGKYISEGDE